MATIPKKPVNRQPAPKPKYRIPPESKYQITTKMIFLSEAKDYGITTEEIIKNMNTTLSLGKPIRKESTRFFVMLTANERAKLQEKVQAKLSKKKKTKSRA